MKIKAYAIMIKDGELLCSHGAGKYLTKDDGLQNICLYKTLVNAKSILQEGHDYWARRTEIPVRDLRPVEVYINVNEKKRLK